ncbi:MAG: hypothetical protein QM698_03410 [Micropepsaceae bacterium]
MTVTHMPGQGRRIFASAPLDPPDNSLGAALAAAEGLDWCAIAEDGALHLILAAGQTLPPGTGDASALWELGSSLSGPLQASLALATGPALDIAAILAPLNAPAVTEAAALARLPVPALDDGPDAAWDRLAHAARRAQALMREGRILAAALTFKGRGRLIGPLNGNLLLRFGVSAWR